MSQTNTFYKAQNPDYVYLDLQQSNVYNNTSGQDVEVNFIETRDSPVVANTGEYYMSVTRFQIDSYNLPTLIVEPDLTQGDVNKSIHKVAILTESATQLNPSASIPIPTTTLATITAPSADTKFGSAIAYSEDLNMAVIGAPSTGSGGALFISVLTGSVPLITTLPVFGSLTSITGLGQSVATTKDGSVIVSLRRNATTDVNNIELLYYDRVGNNYPRPIVTSLPSIGSTVTTADNVIRITDSASALNSTYRRMVVVGCPTLQKANIYAISSTGAILNTLTTTESSTASSLFGSSVAISSNGLVLAVGNPQTATSTSIGVRILQWDPSTSAYVARLDYVPTAGTTRNVGFALAMSPDGRFIVSGAPLDNSNLGRVDIFKKTGATTWAHQQTIVNTTAGEKFGQSVAISDNGLILTVGFGNPTTVDANIYVRTDDSVSFVFATIRGTVTSTPIVIPNAIISNSTGSRLLLGYGPASGTGKVVFESFVTSVPHYIDYLPSALKNIASVANVMWEPTSSAIPAQLNLLSGKNTVENPYYWCNSYDYFVGLVNKALEQASAANYSYLHDEWITAVGTTDTTKGIFYEAAYKSFPTPPFLDWEHDSLKASLYVNQCYNRYLAANYAIPSITWASGVGTVSVPPPFTFRVALNPSLYALFNSFPATETLLTTTTGTVEKFYVLNINSSGYPLVAPAPTIQRTLYSAYTFNDLIYSSTAFTYTLINQPETAISYNNTDKFIQVHQELSTIDTWSPVNGIVFTTNTLPIVTNQFSSNSVINTARPSFDTGQQYALIITDLQTNEQGYKPNLLYNPTAEYRRIDMTGNRGLTNIDIRVFWRAKTGQLIPFKLSSGISASIKILFQKKVLGEKQQIALAQTIKELGA